MLKQSQTDCQPPASLTDHKSGMKQASAGPEDPSKALAPWLSNASQSSAPFPLSPHSQKLIRANKNHKI